MPLDLPPDALIDLEDAAEVLGIPSYLTSVYLESHGRPPAATYHGRPLWLSDAVHAMCETEAAA